MSVIKKIGVARSIDNNLPLVCRHLSGGLIHVLGGGVRVGSVDVVLYSCDAIITRGYAARIFLFDYIKILWV